MVNTERSKNKNWEIGSIVKIGFMQLRVVGVRSVRDFLPDIYTLENLERTRAYEFVPHHGLTRI